MKANSPSLDKPTVDSTVDSVLDDARRRLVVIDPQVRRLKFGVDGNAFNPNTTYLVQTAIDRNSGNLQLE